MENIILTKVSSAFKDNYQKYSIPIIVNLLDNNFLDKSLDRAKKDILNTLINISNKFNRFKANIMLEVDDITLSSYPLEVKYGRVDIGNIDDLIIDILQKYEDLLEFGDIKNIYSYSMYLIINSCGWILTLFKMIYSMYLISI